VLDLGLARLQVEACNDGSVGLTSDCGTADYMARTRRNPHEPMPGRCVRPGLYALLFPGGKAAVRDQRHSTFWEKSWPTPTKTCAMTGFGLTYLVNGGHSKQMLPRACQPLFYGGGSTESLTPFCTGSDLVGF